MFLNIPGPLEYRDPWTSTYDERLRQLISQPKRIAYFYELPDTSTFRYRAFNPGLTLSEHPECGLSGAWFDHRDLAVNDRFIDAADALVLCRVRYSAAVAQMISRARARNIPVLFDCDDLVFDTERLHLIVDALNQDQRSDAVWNYWFSYIGRMGATLRLCDGLITTNKYLAQRANEFCGRLTTAIVPNYLNPQQQALSESLHAIKRDAGWERDGRIHVGYFSGSPSHARDFAVAAPALFRLLDADPRVVLRIVGFADLDPRLTKYGKRVEVYPLQDFMNLQRLIAEVEINISPLQDNEFTNCKSELKFFEAAICGTLTLASPTFAFRNSVRSGETGFLVPSYMWEDALHEAVSIVEDRESYCNIADAAHDYVRGAYGWDQHATTIARSVFGAP
ncbi:glycosyltransferase [Rhizobium leguminosarum]|uniref:glycosyltransferase n=1 Tax=Rhizobium leguminosarum TaxID=384 RepID=UPI003CFE1273